jgi:hypothetical protein
MDRQCGSPKAANSRSGMQRVVFCGSLENVRDSKILLSRQLTAARYCSWIGEEYSVVCATSIYLIQLYLY